jgi:hypothetical protein
VTSCGLPDGPAATPQPGNSSRFASTRNVLPCECQRTAHGKKVHRTRVTPTRAVPRSEHRRKINQKQLAYPRPHTSCVRVRPATRPLCGHRRRYRPRCRRASMSRSVSLVRERDWISAHRANRATSFFVGRLHLTHLHHTSTQAPLSGSRSRRAIRRYSSANYCPAISG